MWKNQVRRGKRHKREARLRMRGEKGGKGVKKRKEGQMNRETIEALNS